VAITPGGIKYLLYHDLTCLWPRRSRNCCISVSALTTSGVHLPLQASSPKIEQAF
jgi:hypothetical protein